MSTAIYAKRLKLLLKKLETAVVEKPVRPQRDPVHEVIHAFMVWNATLEQAEKAHAALLADVLDINELRVCDPDEIVEIIGPRYPMAQERAHHLKRTLHAIYQREHAVSLAAVATKPKREARAYLDSLEGIVPHVAASVMLLSLEGHAIPVDDHLLKRLQEDVVVDADADAAAAQSFLEYQVRASDGLMVHAQLRAYVEQSIKVVLPKAPVIKKAPTEKSGGQRAGAGCSGGRKEGGAPRQVSEEGRQKGRRAEGRQGDEGFKDGQGREDRQGDEGHQKDDEVFPQAKAQEVIP